MIFNTFEEAEEAFYLTNDCISDDPDKEGDRIMDWIEGCGHELNEEEHTGSEWEDIHKSRKLPNYNFPSDTVYFQTFDEWKNSKRQKKYTAWRKFLAWFGLLSLFITPILVYLVFTYASLIINQ